MITHIGQIAIAITNLDASVSFYRDVLGLPLLFEVAPNMAFFQCGDTRLMLTTLQGPESDHQTSTIYYTVTNIAEVFASFEQASIAVERPPQLAANMPDHELWIGFIRDPDANLIGIMEERPLTEAGSTND
jgi:catechol 2,3-dioxygenase-like lactoylglutathione lyase family enzyme